MKRAIAHRAITVCVGLLLGLVAAEAFLRLTGMTPLPLNFASGRSRVPFPDAPRGSFRFLTNSLGYRAPDLPAQKASNEFRLVVLGDSHTNGIGVDDVDRFSDRLERPLSMLLEDRPARVMNFSRAGTTIPDYLADLKKTLPYHPDGALCVIYSGNDLAGMVPYLKTSVVPDARDPSFRDKVLFLPRKLYIYHLLEYSKRMLESSLGASSVKPLNQQEPFTQALGQVEYFKAHPDDLPLALARSGAFLHAIRRECDRSGLRLMVLVLPSKLQVEPNLAFEVGASIAAQLGLTWEEALVSDRHVHEALLATALDVDPDATDLLTVLRQSAPAREEYWRRDWHLNVDGHTTVAGAIMDRFRAATAHHSMPDR